MARSKVHPATSVTFRMPDEVLKIIDELAEKSTHDRTAEINDACRHWIDIGGALGNETVTQVKLSELEKQIGNLNQQITTLEQSIEKISDSLIQSEKTNATLLTIIQSNEHTIKCLLQSFSDQK